MVSFVLGVLVSITMATTASIDVSDTAYAAACDHFVLPSRRHPSPTTTALNGGTTHNGATLENGAPVGAEVHVSLYEAQRAVRDRLAGMAIATNANVVDNDDEKANHRGGGQSNGVVVVCLGAGVHELDQGPLMFDESDSTRRGGPRVVRVGGGGTVVETW